MRYRRRRARGLWWVPSVAALLGCDDPRPQPVFTQVDSLGTVVAVSTSPSWDEGDRWSILEPLLDLTGTGSGPAHEFYRVAGVISLPDGRLVVANAGSDEIRLFSPQGEFLRATGREGDGPGEYRQIAGVARLPPDSLMVFSRPGRVSILDSQLTYGRSFQIQGYWQAIHALGDRTIVVAQADPAFADPDEVGGVMRPHAPLVRYDSEGVVLDTVATTAGYEQLIVPRGTGLLLASFLYGKTMTVAAGNGVIATGAAQAMEFVVLQLNGDTSRVVSVPSYPLEVLESELEAERASYLGPEPSAVRRQILGQTPGRRTRPAYMDIVIDSESHFWIGEYVLRQATNQPRSWDIFDPVGRWLGAVETPANFQLSEIGLDYVLGVMEDELGVERVQLRQLSR